MSSINFACEDLCPSQETHDAISSGLEDILYSATLDAAEFCSRQTEALPQSSQGALSSLVYKLASIKLSLD